MKNMKNMKFLLKKNRLFNFTKRNYSYNFNGYDAPSTLQLIHDQTIPDDCMLPVKEEDYKCPPMLELIHGEFTNDEISSTWFCIESKTSNIAEDNDSKSTNKNFTDEITNLFLYYKSRADKDF